MHTIFIAFVSFVAYATGVVMVQRWRSNAPQGAVHSVELLLALGVVVSGVCLRKPHYSASYVALCVLGMLIIGVSVGSAMRVRKKSAAAGTKEYQEPQGDRGGLSRWKRWLNCSRAVVDYEFRLMLLACYLLVVGPFALVFRLRARKSVGSKMASAWAPRRDAPNMETARRPF